MRRNLKRWTNENIHIQLNTHNKKMAAILKGIAAIFLSTQYHNLPYSFPFYGRIFIANPIRAPPPSPFLSEKNRREIIKLRDNNRQKGGIEYRLTGTDGTSCTLWIGNDGKAKYESGGKKTEFAIEECKSYSECDAKGNETVFNVGVDGIDIVMLAILTGERRLAYNNEQAETRRHISMFSPEMQNVTTVSDNTERKAMQNLGHMFQNDLVDEKFQALKPLDREIAIYYWVDKLSQSEISELVGISRNAVQHRISRIVKRLNKSQ